MSSAGRTSFATTALMGLPRVAAVVHNKNEPPACADPLYTRQRLAEGVWRGIGFMGFGWRAKHAVSLGH
jgi:hypothetical protein